jgi:hypothetical protein
MPSKTTYKVGEAFDPTGLKAVLIDVYAAETEISSEITFGITGVKIYTAITL